MSSPPPMPLLDIAIAQPCFQSRHPYYTLRSRTFLCGYDKRLASSWKSFCVPEKGKNSNVGQITMRRPGLVIKAVATLEPKYITYRNIKEGYHNVERGGNNDSVSAPDVEHQSTKLDEREKLRRMRISQANKGNTPWNKGRKHSPETLQRIRERTRLAMQDPKVKMKLVNLGHSQSEETRIKIGVGVRIGWEKRREKLMLQETCHFEWQNLIAEASRKGFVGEQELHWDSYKILDKELELEWLESVEQRKKMPRQKGSKRAPKSREQRRKISEAIAAKWADPAYRDRVYSGLTKYHGTPVGIEKPRRRPPAPTERQLKRTAMKKKDSDPENLATKNQKSRRRSTAPLYKDPLASSKLEMIKNIRAQRAAADNTKTEAITKARQLIAEAEKAAKALEVAATRSPLAQASLIETRKLIAEAILSIESIETEQLDSHVNSVCSPFTSTEHLNHVEKETDLEIEGLSQRDHKEVNGKRALSSDYSDITGCGFGEFNFKEPLNGKHEIGQNDVLQIGSYDHDGEELHGDYDFDPSELDHLIKQSSFTLQLDQLEIYGSSSTEKLVPNEPKCYAEDEKSPAKSTSKTRKWVRGKLVEMSDEEG